MAEPHIKPGTGEPKSSGLNSGLNSGLDKGLPLEDWDARIAAAAGQPLNMARLADQLAYDQQMAKARDLCARALALAPHEPEVACIAAEILSDSVPAWHAAIVRDRARNEAYDEALRRAIEPGARVLEVGTGTGLLAMMAARAGAGEVISCEMNPLVADRARTIVARNGYADRVRVVAKHSDDLRLGVDLEGTADVFVSEIISGSLLNEAVLPVIENVVPRLVKPGAAIIPHRGSIRVALAWYGGADTMPMTTVDGFDLSAFNGLLAPHYPLQIEDQHLTLSSPAADLFGFAFADGGPFPDRRTQLTLRAKAPANGVVQWIRIRTDDCTFYENAPNPAESSSWSAEFHSFANGDVAEPGQDVTVHGSHNKTALRIWTGKP